MKNLSPILVAAGMFACSACAVSPMRSEDSTNTSPVPLTTAEKRQGPNYWYRPLDPLPVLVDRKDVPISNCRMLEMMPDETMRMAIGEIDAQGNVTYGPAKAGVESKRYVVVLDYMKSDVTNVALELPTASTLAPQPPGPKQKVNVPTYIGVGLRLTANLVVNSGTVDLSNLVLIGAAAQAKQVSGTLVIQTLGISGELISSAIPVPSEISASTIQNALMAIGTIKSKIYDEQTQISPRVVGLHDVFGLDANGFGAFFQSVLLAPPSMTLRTLSSRCPGVSTAAASSTKPQTGR